MKKWITVILASLFYITNYGQTKFDDYAVNLKPGAYSELAKSVGGVCLGFDYDLLKRNTVITIGYNGGRPLNIFSRSPQKINQIYFMYGKFIDIKNKTLRLQYQIGLAPTFGVIRGNFLYKEPGWFGANHYEKIPFLTIGIPVKLGFKIMPSRQTSIGIDLLANFNTKKSVLMPMLNIEIFSSRNKKMRKVYLENKKRKTN